MTEIDLRSQVLPRHRSVLRALNHLSNRIDQSRWCLVGGMMVLVALAERGKVASRSSQTMDADILVDICTSPDVLMRTVHELRTFGYELIEKFGGEGFARCTFVGVGRNDQIDVLCPDDASAEELRSVPGIQSRAIPGGRRALEISELVTIKYDDDSKALKIRVPLLIGAIVVKAAAAMNPATSNQSRHIQDIVDMLLGIDDPADARAEMSSDDRALLSTMANRMANDRDVAWESVSAEQRNRARASYDLLTLR